MTQSMSPDSYVLVFVALAMTRAADRSRDAERVRDMKEVAAVAKGDQAALARLYDRFGRLVFSLAARVCGDAGAAEEITQDVFMKLWHRAGAFDSAKGDLVSWLAAITRNRAIDQLRSRHEKATKCWVPLPESPDTAWLYSTGGHGYSMESADTVRRMLVTLPHAQRQIMELAYFEGFSQSEIAAKLDLPLGTVKTWTRAALQTLRGSFPQ